jgi:membrane-associated phospholipid phosphatase
MLLEIFNKIGGYGPVILIFLSWYLLWNNSKLFFYYTIGIFLNSMFNLILKGIFQEPRPSEDLKKFNLALSQGKRFIFKDNMPHDMFGMPSGHTQSAIFSTTFVYLALKKMNVLYIYLFISLVTMSQRVFFKYHTVLQVIAGGFVGIGIGFIMYYLAVEKIMGKITEKLDDNAPI